MKELDNISANYAAGKANEAIDKAIAQAYADGYRDGYKDREEETPVDFSDNKTEYIDLGLPSGTLWAADYEEKEEGKTLLVPYERSESLCVPTKEQWDELCDICKWEFNINSACNLLDARCAGPNGNVLKFSWTGKTDIDTLVSFFEVFFWIKDDDIDGNDKYAAHIYNAGKANNLKIGVKNTEKCFSGYKLPIRLVRKK